MMARIMIAQDLVAAIDYTLTNDAGKVLDSSDGGQPLYYLHGRGQIVPGLERALLGRKTGDSFQVRLTPDEGYGVRDPERVMKVPKSALPDDLEIEVGAVLSGETKNGEVIPLWIVQVDATEVTLDGNHPLAGEALNFAVTVREVRKATAEELAHGHVHGPGGHHH